MKRLLYLTAAALVGLCAVPARAGDGCSGCSDCNKHCSCMVPVKYCPDCSCPCDKCRCPQLFGDQHVQDLLDKLCHGCCDERIHAAKKLGCQIHADFCKCPEVLNGLVHALMADSCWEVRREAAWAIYYQNARVPQGLVALYVASKLDRHAMVRDAASRALDVLTLCRKECYRDLYLAADKLIVRIRPDYDPTNHRTVALVAEMIDGGHVNLSVSTVESVPPAGKGPEQLGEPKEEAKPMPKEEKKEETKEKE